MTSTQLSSAFQPLSCCELSHIIRLSRRRESWKRPGPLGEGGNPFSNHRGERGFVFRGILDRSWAFGGDTDMLPTFRIVWHLAERPAISGASASPPHLGLPRWRTVYWAAPWVVGVAEPSPRHRAALRKARLGSKASIVRRGANEVSVGHLGSRDKMRPASVCGAGSDTRRVKIHLMWRVGHGRARWLGSTCLPTDLIGLCWALRCRGVCSEA